MLLQVVLTTLGATLAAAQTCTSGAWGCVNNSLSVCQDGKWSTVTACSASQGCRAAPYYDCNGPAGGGGSTTTKATTGATKTTTGATKTTTTTTTTTKAQSSTKTSAVTTTTTKAATTTTIPSGLPLCYPPWNSKNTYSAGTKVSYVINGVYNNYVAAYQGGGAPGGPVGSGWTLDGPCDPKSLNYRPFDKPGIIGYWTTWSAYSRKQNSIDKIDLSGFSAINYAFMNTDANGNIVTFDSFADQNWMGVFNAQRLKYPNLRTIVSIGGWSGSRTFSTIAKSASLTQTFAKNVHTFLDANGFDGVDLDWEYPGGGGIDCNAVDPNDAANFVGLLSALRTELGPTRSISIAVSAEVSHYTVKSTGVNYIKDYMKYINYAQVMTYDFYGSWVPYSDFNSPLNSPGPNDPQEPAQWINAGASPSQLTNGLGFYGRSWSVQSKTNNGLYQLCTGSVNNASCPGIVGDYLDAAQWCDPCKVCYNSGVWMYNNIRGQANSNGQQSAAPLAGGPTSASNGWSRQYFNFAESPTLYSPSYNAKSSFISYDDPQSLKVKAAWAKSQGLGGTMIWELSQDYNAELVNAVRAGWGA
ncbi:glycoside hydrolase superfamily [Obelidium mucronatum]|nr:glycoside hydrolase superfamily [Obelidium mucronatum]